MKKLQTAPVTPLPRVLTLGLVVAEYAGKQRKLNHDLLSVLSDQVLTLLTFIKQLHIIVHRK